MGAVFPDAASTGKGKGRGKGVTPKRKAAKTLPKAQDVEALASIGNDPVDNEGGAGSEESSGSHGDDGDEEGGDVTASAPVKMAVLKAPGANQKPGKVMAALRRSVHAFPCRS